MSLFGYDPRHLYRGRGAYESMGAGLHMNPGDIAFKSNFATLDSSTGIVLQRRADRKFEAEGPALCAALDNRTVPGFPSHTVHVKYATEHRCGVVIRGPRLTDAITGTDPLKDNLPLLRARAVNDQDAEGVFTADIVNAVDEMIRGILHNHPVNVERERQGKPPANVVLLRGCGCRLALPPFYTLHNMRACIVSPTKIIAGLGMCAEMEVLDVPGTTGDYRTLFHRKAEAVASALAQGPYDFAFLHVKAVDDAGHDREVGLRVAYLEVVDAMIAQVVALLYADEYRNNSNGNTHRYTIVVTGDHSTPVEFGDHSHEPVPFAIAHVRHVGEVLGGKEAIDRIPMGFIRHPKAGDGDDNDGAGSNVNGNGRHDAATQHMGNGIGKSRNNNHAPSKTSKRRGDAVCAFTEFEAAQGALGRFPGREMMSIIKQFAGYTTNR